MNPAEPVTKTTLPVCDLEDSAAVSDAVVGALAAMTGKQKTRRGKWF
jgi:hypothetical protein